MFFRSIRFRLTLWYALILVVLLMASGFFWHAHLARNLLYHVDERLLLIAEGVTSFAASSRLEGAEPERCRALEDFLHRHSWSAYVQVLNERGSIACATANLEKFSLPLGKDALQQVARGTRHSETIRLPDAEPLRLLSLPVVRDDRIVAVIQTGESLADLNDVLQDLRLVLLTFSPPVFLALFLGGWFLSGRALSPVVRLTRSMQRINAENLNQRLPVEETHDEIAHLAETFNSMLARLEDSFRRIKQFSADASHELRTPLTILKGETEVALRWAKRPEEFRKMLDSNMEEIDRMGRILENLLTLAKSDAGELPLEIKDLSLSDLLQELYLQAKTLSESKQIEVILKPNVTEEIRIRGDELRLRQMFLNLIANGIKYTPEGGRLELALSVEKDVAVIDVTDTGIGIPEEHLPHIFDRFYRIDKARNREDGGTGLGLSIVKWIVEAHHGRVLVSSRPGRGSTFSIRLPLQGPSKEPKA